MRLLAAAVCAALALSARAADEVRAISEGERAAVAAAADYLSRGPETIYARLADKSPLRHLPKQQALDEIEVRLGPPAGATWELQTVVPALKDELTSFAVSFPSGADETVLFQMSGDRIDDVRILAEPSNVAPLFPAETAAAPVEETSKLPLGLGLFGATLSLAAAFVPRFRHALLVVAVAAVGAAALCRTGFSPSGRR